MFFSTLYKATAKNQERLQLPVTMFSQEVTTTSHIVFSRGYNYQSHCFLKRLQLPVTLFSQEVTTTSHIVFPRDYNYQSHCFLKRLQLPVTLFSQDLE